MRVGALAALLLLAHTSSLDWGTVDQISWDFDADLEGWANATAGEMFAMVSQAGGELHGSVQLPDALSPRADATENAPHIDSPRVRLPVLDREHLVVRMAYAAAIGERTARWLAHFAPRDDALAGSVDHGHARWAPRPAPVCARQCATCSGAKAHAVDGDAYTLWRPRASLSAYDGGYGDAAPVDVARDAWLVVDLGAHAPVSRVTLHAPPAAWVAALERREYCAAQTGDDACDADAVAREQTPARWANASRVVRVQVGRSADGKFAHAGTFTLDRASDAPQVLTGLEGGTVWGRFWRLYVVEWDGPIALRELAFDGADAELASVDFDVRADGTFHTYAAPLWAHASGGSISRLRLYPAVSRAYDAARAPLVAARPPAAHGASVAIDWVRVVRAPTIARVTGCSMGQSVRAPRFAGACVSGGGGGSSCGRPLSLALARALSPLSP